MSDRDLGAEQRFLAELAEIIQAATNGPITHADARFLASGCGLNPKEVIPNQK